MEYLSSLHVLYIVKQLCGIFILWILMVRGKLKFDRVQGQGISVLIRKIFRKVREVCFKSHFALKSATIQEPQL